MLKYDSFEVENLILKPMVSSDFTDVNELFSDNNYCGYFHPAFRDTTDGKVFLDKIIKGRTNDTVFHWGIYIKKKGIFNSKRTGKLIGLILFEKANVNFIVTRVSDYSIGVIVNEKYSCQNIGFIALKRIVDYLIEDDGFKFITGFTSPYNHKSVRLFRNLDFTFLGVNDSEKLVFIKANTKQQALKSQILEMSRRSFVPFTFSPHANKENYKCIFNGFPVLHTENLILRPFHKKDAERYADMINQTDVATEFKGPINSTEAFNYVTYSFPKAYLECKHITWTIELKAENRIIGMRDLFVDSPLEPVETQGFICNKYRNRGFHQEGLNACIELVKKAGFHTILANCSSNNLPAKHILEKTGFFPDMSGLFWLSHQSNRIRYALQIR